MPEPVNFINQMEPWFDEKEADALYAYMKSGGWVTEFKKTREFEEEIRKFVGAKYCSIVSNGTVSLTLALIASGVGKDDEVIVPDYTMVASASAVVFAGAKVIFADVEPETLCLSLKTIAQALTVQTKAVMLVTINGRYPKDLDEIVAFCKEKNIVLIEDAAQSLGSFKAGKHLGTFGDVGSFSFAMPKVITTGQGGALVTNNEHIIEKIRKLRDFGRERPGEDHYLTMGWNFKFTDIQAVIGIEQMKKLSGRLARKKEIFSLYQEQLKNVSEIKFIPTDLDDTSPMFVDVLVLAKREALIQYLKEKGIGTRLAYPALHSEPAFKLAGNYPGAQSAAQQMLWLPSSPKLSDEQITVICAEIRNFYKK
ncbi:DegT/DnrJ/EryC1/StrS family aminotransferase [Candidatus Parcubacteria bacterium]|nr:DegT/DnrJ/EryC1/StrS family aminotransferase [Candidatus Parcubacteria bacterium]